MTMTPLTSVVFGLLASLAVTESAVEQKTHEATPELEHDDEDGVCLMQLHKTRKDSSTSEDSLSRKKQPSNTNAAFSEYVATYQRDYQGAEEWNQRRALFAERVALIQTHNANPNRLWTAGINHLTDRTEVELKQLRGYRKSKKGQSGGPILISKGSETHKHAPAEVDWRTLSMALTVPDQGGCGSCWAVATKSMLEARHESQKNETRTFSAQQLVNCVPNPRECGGTGGCEGATVELAMQYIQDAGLEEETDVPYHGRDMNCEQPMSNAAQTSLLAAVSSMPSNEVHEGAVKLGLQSWRTLPENQAHPLMSAVAEGPVAISVAAMQWSNYRSGIFNGCPENSVVDHAVTLFGYGSDNGVNYWLVRNSWGGQWGESGFIRLFRHDTAEEDDAYCGEDRDPAAGLACKPYPEKVTVCGMCGMLYDSVTASFSL